MVDHSKLLSKQFDHFTMWHLCLFAVFLLAGYSNAEWKPVWITPEQIHLSFGGQTNDFVVTWLTMNKTINEPQVYYGLRNPFENYVNGTTSMFIDEGKLKTKRYVYRALLKGLEPDKVYLYRVGSNDSWSNLMRFKTLPENNEKWSPKILLFGDLGNANDRTLSMMQDEIQNDRHDFIFHIGDFAYNLEHSNGQVGDAFFRDIESMASYKPYQVLVGNHEDSANYSQYDNRFSMYTQGSTEKNNWFWSYDIGPAHIIAFSTEFHYTPQYGTHQIMNQYRWLEEDLKKANDNRDKVPWIITCGHRPLYDNYYINNRLRVGNKTQPGFEQLLYKYGVDLTFWAHDHIYERLWPIYNKKIYNGSLENPYTDPKAPVHIITGSAGCSVKPDPLNRYMPEYNAFASRDYTYMRIKIENRNTIVMESYSVDKGKVIDTTTLVKNSHGPYVN